MLTNREFPQNLFLKLINFSEILKQKFFFLRLKNAKIKHFSPLLYGNKSICWISVCPLMNSILAGDMQRKNCTKYKRKQVKSYKLRTRFSKYVSKTVFKKAVSAAHVLPQFPGQIFTLVSQSHKQTRLTPYHIWSPFPLSVAVGGLRGEQCDNFPKTKQTCSRNFSAGPNVNGTRKRPKNELFGR